MEDLTNANIMGPGSIDMGKAMSRVSETTVRQEELEKGLFETTAMVALALIDPKPNAKGHASYLLLTSRERKDLIGDLDAGFGRKLIERYAGGTQKLTVLSAMQLRKLLAGYHHSQDERK